MTPAENIDWVWVSAFLPFNSGFGRVVVFVALAEKLLKPEKPDNGAAEGYLGEKSFSF